MKHTLCHSTLHTLEARTEAIAGAWWHAVNGGCSSSLDEIAGQRRFLRLVEQLLSVLFSDPFNADEGQVIGTALFDVGCSQPEILSQTQAVLTEQFTQGLAADQLLALYPRLIVVFSELGLGFNRQSQLAARQQAHVALQASRQRFRQFLAATFDAIVLHNVGLILEANDVVTDLFGYYPPELTGKPIEQLFAPEYQHFVHDKTILEANQPFQAIGVRKDGSIFPVELVSKRFPYEGTIIRIVAIRALGLSSMPGADLAEHEQQIDLAFGLLHIDLNQRQVIYGAEELPLSKLEFDLLVYLAQNKERVCTYDELLDEVWGYETDQGDPSLVQLTLHRLRKKFKIGAGEEAPLPINTVRGVGLQFTWPSDQS